MGLTLTGTYNTRQLQIVIVNTILVVLSVAAVSLRVWARRLQGLDLFVEDYLSIFALVREPVSSRGMYTDQTQGLGPWCQCAFVP